METTPQGFPQKSFPLPASFLVSHSFPTEIVLTCELSATNSIGVGLLTQTSPLTSLKRINRNEGIRLLS